MVSSQPLSTEVHHILKDMARLIEQAESQPLSDDQWRAVARRLRSTQQSIAGDLTGLDPSGGAGKAVQFSPEEAIGEVAEVMAPLAAERQLHFDWAINGGLPEQALGDKCLLQEVLQGLLDHYIRSAAGGHVRLSADSTLSGEAAQLRMEISGTLSAGGLQAADLPPSLQLLQERLAEAGGTLIMTDNSSATTCFTFPVRVASAPQDVPANRNRLIKSILVAEDCDESYQLIELYTACEGHSLTRAWNGVEAVARAKTGAFDFIIMDIGMPEMDGHQATRLIREWETEQGRPRIPILLFSAATDEQQVRLGAAVGCSGYLAKPATQKQLLAALLFYARPATQPLDSVH